MNVTMFHFMPYRDLPADFPPKGLASSWIDAPWWEYGNADKVTDCYNWALDELMLAAKLGFDGLGTNEHHQNPYGFMCNPNLFGAILAKMTRDQGFEQVALVQLGATISSTSPPIRIAEEYAVLDCISGGRGLADRFRQRCLDQLRHHADGAPRTLAGGHRPDAQGLDRQGILCVERKVFPIAEGEPMAATGSGSTSAGSDPWGCKLIDLGLLPRSQLPLCLPQLLRRQIG